MTVLEYLRTCNQDVDVCDEDYDEEVAFCWDDSLIEQKEPIDRFNYQFYKRLRVTSINQTDCICANVSSLVRKHLNELAEVVGNELGEPLDGDDEDKEEFLVHFLMYAQAGYTYDDMYTKLADAMEKWDD